MATKKPRITITLDDDDLEKLIQIMEAEGIKEKSIIIQKAIKYYIASVTTDDETKNLFSRDAANTIKRNLIPLSKEVSERDRIIQIMLNLIWKKLNFGEDRLSIDDLKKLVRDAVREIDDNNGSIKVTMLIPSVESMQENKQAIKNDNVISKKDFSNLQKNINSGLTKKEKSDQAEIERKQNNYLEENQYYKKNESSNKNNSKQESTSLPGGWGDTLFADND